jgi:hypothetical protein
MSEVRLQGLRVEQRSNVANLLMSLVCCQEYLMIEFGMPIAMVSCVTRTRRALRLLAETGREIGILIVVFAPLETMFAGGSIDNRRVFAAVAVGATLIAFGILVETKD